MSDLTEFLLARIAEDEADAQMGAFAGASWRALPADEDALPPRNQAQVIDDGNAAILTAVQEYAQADHVARHDPARVLAECEAKRRIVAMQAEYDAGEPLDGTVPDWLSEDGTPGAWNAARSTIEHTLLLLALPYADHPDYREKWRP